MRLVPLSNFEQFAAINPLVDQGLIAGPKLVDNCAEITLFFSLGDGKTGHIILGGRYIPPFSGTQVEANAILSSLTGTAAWTALAQHLSPQTSLHQVGIRDINTKENPTILSTVTEHVGTSTGVDMPNEVALVITLSTGKAGPRYRGRMYMPGWATTALGANNLVNAAAVTALQNWAGTIQSSLNGSGFTWCLALPARNGYTSATTGRVFDPRPKETPSIIQTTVNNHWDSQRRRGLR
jgi:hypothetical protein